MKRDLNRLLRPKSIVLIGGGAWGAQVIRQSKRMGFQGALYIVHPKAVSIEAVPAFGSLAELPEVPDAAFIGVNRKATVEVVAELSAMGAGGAVCFASGFSEAEAEDDCRPVWYRRQDRCRSWGPTAMVSSMPWTARCCGRTSTDAALSTAALRS
jgi:acyl-CoA synthetase (NDP forming)